MPTLAQLAESTAVHLLPQPGYERVVRDEFTYIAGPNNAWVLDPVAADVDWTRAETRRRGLKLIEWWIGWSAPAGLADELLERGLEPANDPVLTGMTCATEPPGAPGVDVRPLEKLEEYLAAVAVDWDVWEVPAEERERRLRTETARLEANQVAGTVHEWAAYDGGAPVGFGRAIDMADGAALMGGAVLPSARGRGIYRALVHARWEYAAGRGTPLLVVQAGRMSAPILAGLGFESHGEIRLYADRL